MSEQEKIEDSAKFWDKIIRYADGTINEEQLAKELQDYLFLLREIPKVYDHLTGGKLSKAHYLASVVISAVEECQQRSYEAIEKEDDKEDWFSFIEYAFGQDRGTVQARYDDWKEKAPQ